jgi:hypothetical protein
MTSIVDRLRSREEARRILDPSDHRLHTGTPEQQLEARRELRRNSRIARIVNNPALTEIPRHELKFGAHPGRVIEHVASPDGDFYLPFGGDPDYTGDDVTAYFFSASGNPILLQRCRHPASRHELEQTLAERQAARNAPKPRPAWMAR